MSNTYYTWPRLQVSNRRFFITSRLSTHNSRNTSRVLILLIHLRKIHCNSLVLEKIRRSWVGGGGSNNTGLSASDPGADCKDRPVWMQTCPKTRHTASWLAKPSLVPTNPQVLPGLARPVSSNVRCSISGCSINGCIQILYCSLQNINHGTLLSFLDVLATCIVKNRRDTFPAQSWKWASTERQRFLVLHLG